MKKGIFIMTNEIEKTRHATFESLRQVNQYGQDFWSARELGKVLGYSEYRHFLPVIEKAREACKNSGQATSDHFEDILEMVDIGSGAKRQTQSIALSRYACYPNVESRAEKAAKQLHY